MAAGRRGFLPVWALLATLALQAHVGSAPVLAVLVAGPLAVGLVRSRHQLGAWVKPLGVAAVLLAVFWVPPLAQQSDPPPGLDGNLTLIYDFATDGPAPHQSWDDVRGPLALVSPLTVAHFGSWLGGRPTGVIEPRPTDYAVLVVLLLGLVAAVVLGARERSPFHLSLGVAGLLAIPATIFAAFRVVGDLYPYLVFYAVSASLVAWIATATVVVRWGPRLGSWALARLSARRSRPRHLARPATTARPFRRALRRFAPAGLLVVASLGLAVQAGGLEPAAELRNSVPAARLGTAARAELRQSGTKRVLLDMNQTRFDIGSGVARDLEDHGYEVTVAGVWRSTFGEGSRRTGRERVRLVVTPTGVTYPTRPGDRLIASSQGSSLWIGTP